MIDSIFSSPEGTDIKKAYSEIVHIHIHFLWNNVSDTSMTSHVSPTEKKTRQESQQVCASPLSTERK